MNEKQREYMKKWREEHREEQLAKMRAKYAANKELLRAKAKLWRQRYKLTGPTVSKSEKCCFRCKEVKPIEQFNKDATNSDGYGRACKPCASIVKDEWRKKNPEEARRLSREQAARTRLLPDEKRLKHSRKFYKNNKAICHQRTADWVVKNRKQVNATKLARHKVRMVEDPNYRFAYRTRASIRLILGGHCKSAPTEKLLGCTIAELKRYLELQWEPWMQWSNYGSGHGKWCIDHKVPVDAFDLSDPDQQKLCFHYTNLRPLCCRLNIQKSNQYQPEEMKQLRERVFSS